MTSFAADATSEGDTCEVEDAVDEDRVMGFISPSCLMILASSSSSPGTEVAAGPEEDRVRGLFANRNLPIGVFSSASLSSDRLGRGGGVKLPLILLEFFS